MVGRRRRPAEGEVEMRVVGFGALVDAKSPAGLRRQLRDVLIVLVLAVALILFFVLVSRLTGVEFAFLSKEPAETLEVRKHIGAFAHTVVLLWVPAAVTGIVAGLLHAQIGQRRRAAFYLAAGVFSLALLLDDLFLLHESFYPRVGIPQVVVYAVYAFVAVGLVLLFWPELSETRGLVMVLAGGAFLAASVVLDILPRVETVHVIEDGAKAIGVAMWTVAITRGAISDLRPRSLL